MFCEREKTNGPKTFHIMACFWGSKIYVVVLIHGKYSTLQCTLLIPSETRLYCSLEIPVATSDTYKGDAWMKRSLHNEALHGTAQLLWFIISLE